MKVIEQLAALVQGIGAKSPSPVNPQAQVPDESVLTPELILMTVATLCVFGILLGGKKAVLHLVGLMLVILDFSFYVISGGPIYTIYKLLTARRTFAAPVYTVPINGSLPESQVWRSVEAIAAKQMETGKTGDIDTAFALLKDSYEKNASKQAQGTRKFLEWKTEEGERFPSKVFGETEWRTFGELAELAHAFGAGMRTLGIGPQPADALISDHKGVLIYEDTCADWMLACQGCFTQDIVVATSYATLGADSVIKAVNQGGVTALICNRKAVAKLEEQLPNMPSLKCIIYTDNLCTPEEVAEGKPGSWNVYSVEDVIALGKKTPCAPNPPKPDSLAVLMYTSGSTGDPKGVMVCQKHLLAMMSAVNVQFQSHLGGLEDEVYLGYLPLAHILEIVSEFYHMCAGNSVGYADPKSLLAGPGRARPTGAFDAFSPSMMAGVPKVWEGIRSGALAKVEAAGEVAAFLIKLAVRMKALAESQYRYTPLFKVLLKKFKKLTGGNLKIMLSGGGAISAEVQEWCRTALDCPLVQGYGLTETCAGATIQMPDDMSIGIAGTPLSCIEIALHSEPEITDTNNAPYLSTDTVHSTGEACGGRGEVWLRGSNVTGGYYKMAELTKADFDEEGWFHTGDIGMLTPGGALKIIDRKKNLVKLKGGEYVALERMNTAYNASSFVNVDAGGVCCYADDSLDRSVCVAQCKPSELEKAAATLGVAGEAEELCSNPKVQEAVLASFKAVAKTAGLQSLETVVAVFPVVSDWAGNGCLTATQKLVPRKVFTFEAKALEQLKPKGRRG
eukprot:CAMPEP_0183331580 /NCGR_PEP_ID=MMETSP0164_2-20130417/921_1 /TAXON_ID=221442 /ORGANISM="Coccolithus pelagicus ssp braarudi, Strain PLY182g" /LENGTH=788 /DNA_ID=CAMNT_0025500093 /DNA_START=25 /DNA_END=2391 /DNA_ORIENTATION=+